MADPRLFRLGYYQIATGSGRNYDTILGTLELISDQAGKVNGIPFKLRMVKEHTTYVDDGKRKKTEKWFLQLEPDPTFTRKLYSRTASGILALPSAAVDASSDIPDAEFSDAEFSEVEETAPPPFAEGEGPATNEQPDQDDIPEAVQAAMDFVTPQGARLGDCTPEELRRMLDFCISKPRNKVAQVMKCHIETILEPLADI